MTSITIRNPRICKFYLDNPSIHFETINLQFIDIFEKMFSHFQDAHLAIENQELLKQMNDTVNSLKEDILSMNSQRIDNAIQTIADIKSEYITELHAVMDGGNYEKLSEMLEDRNRQLFDKTTTAICTALPKNNDSLLTYFREYLDNFYTKIRKDTDDLLQTTDTKITSDSIKDFIQHFELKSSIMINSLQQPICSFILASENRINQQIATANDENARELVILSQKIQDKLVQDIDSLLNSHRTPNVNLSPIKGNPMLGMLTKMYNSAEIIVCETQPTNSLIQLKRMRKQPVFIKSLEIDENVLVDDVNQFISSIEDRNACGILVSQKSGISNKKDFTIEIYNHNVVVFVHNGDYSTHKIESAINIIDNLYTKIRQFSVSHVAGSSDFHIPKDVLDSINQEYQTFISQKNAILELLKENQKKVTTQLDEFRFPQLDKYLATKYCTPIQKPGLKCDICKSFSGNNLKALAAHKRGCIRISIAAQNHANVATVSILSA